MVKIYDSSQCSCLNNLSNRRCYVVFHGFLSSGRDIESRGGKITSRGLAPSVKDTRCKSGHRFLICRTSGCITFRYSGAASSFATTAYSQDKSECRP
jgi:hypothetical protein